MALTCPIDINLSKCKPPAASEAISKLRDLLEHPISISSTERHMIHLAKYLSAAEYIGISLQDVGSVAKAMTIIFDRIYLFPAYRPPFMRVIRMISKPLLIHNASDEALYLSDLSDFYTFIGYMILNPIDEKIKMCTLSSAILMLHDVNNRHCDPRFVSSIACTKAIEESYLPGILTTAMENSPDYIFTFLLHMATQIINQSPKSCEKMVSLQVIDFTIRRMIPREQGEFLQMPEKYEDIATEEDVPDLNKILTFLWGVLIGLRYIPVKRRLNLPEPRTHQMWILRYLLRKSLLKRNTEMLRNSLMGVIIAILATFGTTRIIQSGMAHDFAFLSVIPDVSRDDQKWTTYVNFIPSNLDLKFKKLVLLALCYSTKSIGFQQVGKECQVVEGLLKIVNSQLEPIRIPWSRPQHRELLTTILRSFPILIPAQREEFVKINGIKVLLDLVERYAIEPYEFDILKAVIDTINAILPTNEKILASIQKNGYTVEILTTYCETLLEKSDLTRNYQRLFCCLFNILETLSSRHGNIKNIQSSRAVPLSLQTLERLLKPRQKDSTISNKLVMCVGAYIWESICWHSESLNSFAQRGGVYMILDIIQQSIYAVQIIYLGILVEFCDEGTCVPHLLTWKGGPDKKITLIPLLLSIFRVEGNRHGIQTTSDGGIADPEIPIMGSQQWFETFYLTKNPTSTPATVDLLSSCRPKIYALITLLRTRYENIIDIATDHYQIYNPPFSPLDQVTMKVAENFLALKLRQVWEELNRDLVIASMKPLALDYELVSNLISRHKLWVTHLAECQADIMKKAKNKDVSDLETVYESLRTNRLQSSLAGLRELEQVARTSDVIFRKKSGLKRDFLTQYGLVTKTSVHNGHGEGTELEDSVPQEPKANENVTISDISQPNDAKPTEYINENYYDENRSF